LNFKGNQKVAPKKREETSLQIKKEGWKTPIESSEENSFKKSVENSFKKRPKEVETIPIELKSQVKGINSKEKFSRWIPLIFGKRDSESDGNNHQ